MFPFSWHDEFVIPSPVVADLNVSEAVIARSTKSESVFVLTFGWAWLFGGNFFSSILRFPKFLRNALLNERPVQPPNLQPTAKERGDSAAGR
jgi:hypothetical protein